MKLKAISTVVSAALIVAIALGLTSTAYIWGSPLIEKRQQATVTERVFNQFSQENANSLPKIIEDVANNRGTRTFTMNADGLWILDEEEDTIEFTFVSRTSNLASRQCPVSLTSGVQCVNSTSLETSPQCTPYHISPSNGTLGQDSSSVICAKASREQDTFNITYKIWFRDLYDNPFLASASGFKIDLVKDSAGLAVSTGKTVKVTFSDSTQETIGSKTLITKKIKILLI